MTVLLWCDVLYFKHIVELIYSVPFGVLSLYPPQEICEATQLSFVNDTVYHDQNAYWTQRWLQHCKYVLLAADIDMLKYPHSQHAPAMKQCHRKYIWYSRYAVLSRATVSAVLMSGCVIFFGPWCPYQNTLFFHFIVVINHIQSIPVAVNTMAMHFTPGNRF